MKILLIDDEKILRDVVTNIIYEIGDHDVIAVESAEDALTLINQGHDFNCQIVDIRMNGMDGNEYLMELKKREIYIKTIVITGFAGSVADTSNKILLKPFTIEQLNDALNGK